jgi:SAM-dependent methyltransferase
LIDTPRVRIVFIGGYARTGSTLLDRLLGQIEGFASFGELRHIWDRSFLGGQLCGCGRGFRDCPFWRDVAGEAFGGIDAAGARSVSRAKRSTDSFWNIPRIAAGGWPSAYRRRLDSYRDAVRTLYVAIRDVSGARFLVDSTKDPQHAYLLHSIPGFDVRMIHLIRDSRPVAFSWSRIRPRPEVVWERRDMPRFPVIRTAMAWNLANVAAEATSRAGFPYVRVRYEDLVRAPREELRRILETLDLGAADLDFLEDGKATLEPAHTVAGNPLRFETGVLQIRPDEEWRGRMPAADRVVVSALTFPLLGRYGYLPSRHPRSGPRLGEMLRTARLALSARQDLLPFCRSVSGLLPRYLASRGIRLEGRWLDVGTGAGTVPEALTEAGAQVVALDLSDRRIHGVARTPFVQGSGERLPFADGSFDGVISSNVLEHVPDPWPVIDELIRVCRQDGSVYLSWTNWYSPFGGHDWSPLHYLGTKAGPSLYQAIRGRPPVHVPGRNLFPVHVGTVLRGLTARSVSVEDVAPRYWPSLRLLARVPGLREVALWNCVMLLRRRPLAFVSVGGRSR